MYVYFRDGMESRVPNSARICPLWNSSLRGICTQLNKKNFKSHKQSIMKIEMKRYQSFNKITLNMRRFFYTTVYVWDVLNILNKEKRKKKRKGDRYRWKGGRRGGGRGRQRMERWEDMGSTAIRVVTEVAFSTYA